MIVPTMNSTQIRNEILSEYSSVCSRATFLANQLTPGLAKTKHKYFQNVNDYQSPLNNKWLIFIEHFVKQYITIHVVYYWDDYGFKGIMVNKDLSFAHFTEHFLKRYNERFLKQVKILPIELLKLFIKKNPTVTFEIIDEEKKSFFGKFPDGIGLGYLENVSKNRSLHFKTFISNEMLFETQLPLKEALSTKFKDYWDENYSFKDKKIDSLQSSSK